MKKQSEATPIKSPRDAYKVRGFHVLAQLDSYDIEPPALVLTLSRRAKKPCAAAAGKFAAAFTTAAGGAHAISSAGIAKFMSTLKCAASHAKPAA